MVIAEGADCMIEIKADKVKEAQQLLEHIPGAIPKALKTAINKSIRGAKTEASKKVREEYVIQSSRITETMSFKFASTENLSAYVMSKGRPRALTYFKTRPSTIPIGRPKNQLFAQVKKSGGGTIRGAFLALMKSGHLGVFNRMEGNASFPIKQLYGPSVPQMLENPSVSDYIETKTQERLESNIDHEVNAFLNGYRK